MKWPIGPILFVPNTILALIPLGLAYLACWVWQRRERRGMTLLFAVVSFVWLVFLPNSCYIVEEWRHFFDRGNPVLWPKLIPSEVRLAVWRMMFFGVYTSIGMIAFTLSLRKMSELLGPDLRRRVLIAVPLFLLLSVGFYLGLMERHNSWDVLVHPVRLATDLARIPDRRHAVEGILGCAVFLWVAYVLIDMWIDGVKMRWSDTVARASGTQSAECSRQHE